MRKSGNPLKSGHKTKLPFMIFNDEDQGMSPDIMKSLSKKESDDIM